jgi:hypothetical protein
MRKEIYRMADAEAMAVLERSPVVHLASTDAEGGPILRTVHGVVVDGALAFHGRRRARRSRRWGGRWWRRRRRRSR